MLRKVKMYGELADFVGHKELEAVVKNPAEAVRFLVTNFPKLEAYMANKYYQVLVGKEDVGKEDLHNPIGQDDIHIVPLITGAGGNSPFGRILLGAALIGASFLFPGAGMFGTQSFGGVFAAGTAGGVATGTAFMTGLGSAISAIGAGLVLNGVSEMLFPIPKPDMPEDDPRISFSFSGVQNTSRAGTAHPIVYGEVVTGSVVISAGIDTDQVQA
jgi:predicted phage tail protein